LPAGRPIGPRFHRRRCNKQRKQDRFPAADNPNIATNEAFFLNDYRKLRPW
jgi:hypothetical protein